MTYRFGVVVAGDMWDFRAMLISRQADRYLNRALWSAVVLYDNDPGEEVTWQVGEVIVLSEGEPGIRIVDEEA